ncbi:hypothetical protein M0Q50_03640 [bacterium]|nr:hypothetical protein [bacterium]
MKKGIVACLLTGLFLTSCTNVVVWTPGQANDNINTFSNCCWFSYIWLL